MSDIRFISSGRRQAFVVIPAWRITDRTLSDAEFRLACALAAEEADCGQLLEAADPDAVNALDFLGIIEVTRSQQNPLTIVSVAFDHDAWEKR